MIKILVSACLLGERVRYNGTDKPVNSAILEKWQQEGRLVPLCPELQGGLLVPRNPAEIVGGEGQDVLRGTANIRDEYGGDVTAQFLQGAHKTLECAQQAKVAIAILTERSPSCGSTQIYNGQFAKIRIPGMGVTARLLDQNGIRVFSHEHLEAAHSYLQTLESR